MTEAPPLPPVTVPLLDLPSPQLIVAVKLDAGALVSPSVKLATVKLDWMPAYRVPTTIVLVAVCVAPSASVTVMVAV